MGFARAAANRMLLVDEGLIIEEATPEKLFSSTLERTQKFLGKVLH